MKMELHDTKQELGRAAAEQTARKAVAVRNCLKGDVSPQYPSSLLQHHEDCTVYLDRDSASLLSGEGHLSGS